MRRIALAPPRPCPARNGAPCVMRCHVVEPFVCWVEEWRRPPEPPKTCDAKTRAGTPCRRSPVRGRRRCRLHGGCSTGPRTEAGRKRISASERRRWAQWAVSKVECKLIGVAAGFCVSGFAKVAINSHCRRDGLKLGGEPGGVLVLQTTTEKQCGAGPIALKNNQWKSKMVRGGKGHALARR